MCLNYPHQELFILSLMGTGPYPNDGPCMFDPNGAFGLCLCGLHGHQSLACRHFPLYLSVFWFHTPSPCMNTMYKTISLSRSMTTRVAASLQWPWWALHHTRTMNFAPNGHMWLLYSESSLVKKAPWFLGALLVNPIKAWVPGWFRDLIPATLR